MGNVLSKSYGFDRKVKSAKIGSWKNQGMVSDNWDAVFERYMTATVCEECKDPFRPDEYSGGRKLHMNNKKLDHDHNTAQIRNVVCSSCNTKRAYRDGSRKFYCSSQPQLNM